jgi:hypothetical protein
MSLPLIPMVTTVCLSACTYTRAVSETNVPRERGRLVEAAVAKNIILGFNFDNDEVLQLTRKLRDKCPSGSVRGIMTQDLTTLYVGFFYWERKTLAKGYCVNGSGVADNTDGAARSLDGVASGPDGSLEPEISL